MMRQKGFSLVELMVVLSIIGIALLGVTGQLSSWHHLSGVKASNINLDKIKAQVLKFGVVNKYLPCPDSDGDGYENRVGGTFNTCAVTVGTTPYLTIGLKQEEVLDDWNNPIRYAVNIDTNDSSLICDKRNAASLFCNAAAGVTPWFTLTDTPPLANDRGNGNYYVCNSQSASCDATAVATNSNLATNSAAVVLVAYNDDGAQTLRSCGTQTGATLENCDTDLYYHQQTNSTADGKFFDDSVIYISGYEAKTQILTPMLAWDSFQSSTASGLTPTYEDFDITSSDTVPILNDTDTPDVILVSRDVSQSLNLQAGDDYITVGNDLKTGADLDSGSGNDSVYIVGDASANISLGTGDDAAVLARDLSENLDANKGNDKVWIQGNVLSGSFLTMGNDDDVLWVGSSDSPTSGVLHDNVDGGSGYDIIVLENVAQWSDLTSTEKGYIDRFELVYFSADSNGNRSYCFTSGNTTCNP